MNATTYNVETQSKILKGGLLAEGVTGIAGVVLAILGLANILRPVMAPVSTIVLGAALLFEGGAVTARFSDLLSRIGTRQLEISELGIGLTAEMIGGIAGIVLGVLALLNVHPMVMLSAAVIVFGVTLLFGSSVTSRINTLQVQFTEEKESFRKVAGEAIAAAAGAKILLGLAAVTLGILSLVGMSPYILTLIALLCVGCSDLLSGTAISGRLMSMVHA